MISSNRIRYTAVFVGLVLAILVLAVWNIASGSVDISFGQTMKVLAGLSEGDQEMAIIWKIRMPRMITSAVLGGALALSGFLMQTFFGNPIAGPFVLGISSGSKMFVALALIVFMSYTGHVSSFMLIVAAFVGALVSMGFVLLVSKAIRQMSMLLVAGIMIGYICTAVTEFLITFANDSDIVNLHNWAQGSFSGMDWDDVRVSVMLVGVILVLVFFLSKPISAYQMGESYAMSMGVNVKRFRTVLILLSSLLAGCVTAFAGPISFVGIAVPHIVKLLLKTAKPIVVIPASFLGGGAFCMFCDYIARTAFSPLELSISTVTAVFGAPVVIWMLITRQGEKNR